MILFIIGRAWTHTHTHTHATTSSNTHTHRHAHRFFLSTKLRRSPKIQIQTQTPPRQTPHQSINQSHTHTHTHTPIHFLHKISKIFQKFQNFYKKMNEDEIATPQATAENNGYNGMLGRSKRSRSRTLNRWSSSACDTLTQSEKDYYKMKRRVVITIIQRRSRGRNERRRRNPRVDRSETKRMNNGKYHFLYFSLCQANAH